MGKFPIGEKNKNKCKTRKTTKKWKPLKLTTRNEKKQKKQKKRLKQQMKIKRVPTKWKWKYMSNLFFVKPKLEEPQMSEGKKRLAQKKNEFFWRK